MPRGSTNLTLWGAFLTGCFPSANDWPGHHSEEGNANGRRRTPTGKCKRQPFAGSGCHDLCAGLGHPLRSTAGTMISPGHLIRGPDWTRHFYRRLGHGTRSDTPFPQPDSALFLVNSDTPTGLGCLHQYRESPCGSCRRGVDISYALPGVRRTVKPPSLPSFDSWKGSQAASGRHGGSSSTEESLLFVTRMGPQSPPPRLT